MSGEVNNSSSSASPVADANVDFSLKTVSQSLFRFTLATIFLVSFTFIVISSAVIQSSLGEMYEKSAEREAYSLQASLEQLVNAKISTLEDHASLPFVVNSVMHAESDKGMVKDYLENLRILNNKVDIVLLDINGAVVESTLDSSVAWGDQDWVFEIVDNNAPSFVSIYDEQGKPHMRMAVPVLYNSHVEGVLVGITPSMVNEAFDGRVAEQGMAATVYYNDKPVHRAGVIRDESSYVKVVDVPSINGSLELVVYKTALTEGMVRLLVLGGLAGLLACIAFVLVFRKLGIRLVIEPQRLLEKSRLQTLKVNKKLEIANEELAQFSYRASHDLKAPLVSARGLAELVATDIEVGEYDEAVSNVKLIGSQLIRLERLVTDILDLARADLQESFEQQVDLSELLDDIAERLGALSNANGVQINVHVEPETRVIAARPRITQVLENLISNGVKYSNPKKANRYVDVKAVRSDKSTEIVIEDNGLGIPQEHQSEVFDMFKRFHPKVSFGSGLGLYIIKKHIDNMNANLAFESTSEGSVFRVSFPTSG